MASFRPKGGGNGSLASIEIGQPVYMMSGVSAEPSSSVLAAKALPFSFRPPRPCKQKPEAKEDRNGSLPNHVM